MQPPSPLLTSDNAHHRVYSPPIRAENVLQAYKLLELNPPRTHPQSQMPQSIDPLHRAAQIPNTLTRSLVP